MRTPGRRVSGKLINDNDRGTNKEHSQPKTLNRAALCRVLPDLCFPLWKTVHIKSRDPKQQIIHGYDPGDAERNQSGQQDANVCVLNQRSSQLTVRKQGVCSEPLRGFYCDTDTT